MRAVETDALDDTTGEAINLHEHDRPRTAYVRHRVLADATVAVIVLIVALAFANVAGVQSDHVVARGGDHELTVHFGRVSRAGLATPLDIEVRRAGGFDGPVRLAIRSDYVALFDENGLNPAPDSETTLGPWTIWEFDRPPGDTLSIAFDARIEPARQVGAAGWVAVLDADDEPIVDARFETTVFP